MGTFCRNKCRILFVFICSLVDTAASTVTLCHGTDCHRQFILSVYYFHIQTSMFDLWVLAVFRTSLLLGALVGVSLNSSDGIHKVRKIKFIIVFLATGMWMYSVVKLLIYTEHTSDLVKPWFWSLFSWSVIAAPLLYINWVIVGNCSHVSDSYMNLNSSEQERQPLPDNSEANHDRNEDTPKATKEKTSNVWRLIQLSKPDIPFLFIAAIFMVVSSVGEVFIPLYTGQVIQGIAIDRSLQKFTRAIIWMSVFSIVSAVSAGIRGGFFKVAMARLNFRIRNRLFSSLVRQEIGFYDVTKTGDITSRLTSDASTMTEALSLNTNIFLRSLIKAVGVCVFMFKLSWQLSLVTVIGLPVVVAVSKIYGDFYEKLSEKVQDSLAKANEVAEETCSSMRTVRSFANETAEALRYADKLKVTFKLQIKEAVAFAGYMWSTELFSLGLLVATLYYGGLLVVENRLSGGNLVSFVLYQMELGYAIESIGNVYTGLMQAVGASAKVFEFMDRKPKLPNDGKLRPTDLEGRVEFRKVRFAYPSRPDTTVLKGVSFSVEPGEVVALVGPSGGGKSSCVNLLEHFYETEDGQVLLDGHSIQQYDHSYLHQKIALVGQEPVLYARSIKENIGYGIPDCSMQLVQNAATQANAHNFISEMKDKYDTETGEKGLQLSGGQKQRVAIARAIIRKPTILLLDEATSALDSESEHVVQQALYQNLEGRTVIIVAHRLSTVERAHRIIVLDKGEVVEQGTHVQLLRREGMYAKLVQRQLLGFDISLPDHITRPPSPDNLSSASFKSLDQNKSSGSDNGSQTGSFRYGSPKFGSFA